MEDSGLQMITLWGPKIGNVENIVYCFFLFFKKILGVPSPKGSKTRVHRMGEVAYIYIYIHIYIYVKICKNTYEYIYIYVCDLYVYIHVYMYICVYIYIYMCTYIFTFRYVCTYMFVYTSMSLRAHECVLPRT